MEGVIKFVHKGLARGDGRINKVCLRILRKLEEDLRFEV